LLFPALWSALARLPRSGPARFTVVVDDIVEYTPGWAPPGCRHAPLPEEVYRTFLRLTTLDGCEQMGSQRTRSAR